jgi:hypothetical protein
VTVRTYYCNFLHIFYIRENSLRKYGLFVREICDPDHADYFEKRSCCWIEYEDGSFIEEYGPDIYRYVLERDETDVLIFCDSVRTLDDVKIHFSHIDEARLSEILTVLEGKALLFHDTDSSSLISVVEAWRREPGYSIS